MHLKRSFKSIKNFVFDALPSLYNRRQSIAPKAKDMGNAFKAKL